MPEVKELRNRGMVYSLGLPVYQINLKTKNEPAIYRHPGKTSRGLQGCSEISSFETTQLVTLYFMYELIVPRRLVDTHESKHFASQPHVSMSCYLMCDTRKHLVCPCKLGSGESGGGAGRCKKWAVDLSRPLWNLFLDDSIPLNSRKILLTQME